MLMRAWGPWTLQGFYQRVLSEMGKLALAAREKKKSSELVLSPEYACCNAESIDHIFDPKYILHYHFFA